MTNTQRVSNIQSNSSALNSDYDVSLLWNWLLGWKGGILFSDDTKKEFSFDLASGVLSAGDGISIASAVILCTRPTSNPIPNQKFLAQFQFTGDVTLAKTNGTKIYIEILENLINDPTLIEDPSGQSNYAKGFNIGEIKATPAYPAHSNYIKLWEINGSGVLVDVREQIRLPDNKMPTFNRSIKDLNDVYPFINPTTKKFLVWDNVNHKRNLGAVDITDVPQQSSLLGYDYILGESCLKGKSLFVESEILYANATISGNIGDFSQNKNISIAVIGSGVSGNTLKLALAKVLSPSVDLKIRIEGDNNGKPNGTLIDPNAIATITPASLTTSLADTTVTLSGLITIARGIKCHIVLYVGTYGSETINSTNYYVLGYMNKNTNIRNLNIKDYLGRGNTYRYDFIGTSLDTSYWDNFVGTGFTINNNLIFSKDLGYYSGYAQFTEYLKSTAVFGSDLISFQFSGKDFTNNASGNVYGTGCLYIDNNNYISISLGTQCITKVVVGGTTVSTTTIANQTTVKMEYNRTTGLIKFFYYSSGWVQIGSNYTNIIAGNIKFLFTYSGYKDVAGAGIGGTLYDVYTSPYFYTGATPDKDLYNKFGYATSTLFESKVLAKTDAKYNYKLPDILRITNNDFLIGDTPKYDFDGLSKSFSGITNNVDYFVSNTPGEVSTTEGTNIFKIGTGVGTDGILLNSGHSKLITLKTAGLSANYSFDSGAILAPADGIIRATTQASGASSGSSIVGYIGDTSSPSIIMMGCSDGQYQHFHVKKGWYYKFVVSANVNTTGGSYTVSYMQE